MLAASCVLASLVAISSLSPASSAGPYGVPLEHRFWRAESTFNYTTLSDSSSGDTTLAVDTVIVGQMTARETLTVAAGSMDTTESYSGEWISWTGAAEGDSASDFQYGLLIIWSDGDVEDIDSVYVATDFGPRASGPWVPGEEVGYGSADGDGQIFVCSLFAQPGDPIMPPLMPWLRWRIRVVGEEGGYFPGMHITWSYFMK